ncbi:molybdopterin-guanine dinucleotide biosynthesis protein MobB [Paucidesulfovibrio longus]|uniref:molybdopterin-guanine dinucleotide biosynthesis protein MobB n=1 Tax=Paucidesulfovibrio longus TaxID=889 RepID=UPI0003B3F43B|nr:molybdopterin-guanine dinucleotide biosynthesis protein MobB [Paucidesulfovibrio longus]
MKAISLVGYKNSGKTTVGVALVATLKARGLNVAAAKFSSCGFDEPEHADTRQYKAVADTVLGLSEKESFVSWPGERGLLRMLPLLEADVLVVEGGKSLGYMPRIIVGREDAVLDDFEGEALDPALALGTFGGATIADKPLIKDINALADLVMEKGFLLPGLSCGGCGRKGCRALARDIVAGTATVHECVTTGDSGISVSVNGAELALNHFVARILASGLKGMLGELKGYVPGKVKIEFEG